MESKPTKPQASTQDSQTYFETAFGYFAHFKLVQDHFDTDKVKVLAKIQKKGFVDPKRAFFRRMLDSTGYPLKGVMRLPTEDDEQLIIRRTGSSTFEIHLDGFLEYSDAKVGDTLELHFRVIDGVFEKACMQIVDPVDRDSDIEFANIILQSVQNQNDPIWFMGAELIEKSLRLTNPEDKLFYGSKSGSLGFWSIRSYDAREEIYIQWRWNTVGELYVEAVSNKYAWPKISVDGINHLLATGWSGPSEDEEDDLPNYFRTYEDVDVAKVSRELMAVLRDVYLVKRDWIWLWQPFEMVEALFKGKTEDDYRFKASAFFIYDQKQTYKRRCEMGVQLSEDILPPKWLTPFM